MVGKIWKLLIVVKLPFSVALVDCLHLSLPRNPSFISDVPLVLIVQVICFIKIK